MLDYLKGGLGKIDANGIVLDARGAGIRVRVPAPERYANRSGNFLTVWTSLDIQERKWTVYGFATPGERDDFEELRRIPGIGAATALKLILHVKELKKGECPELRGIGPAKRRRILRWFKGGKDRPGADDPKLREVRLALQALGFSSADAKTRAAAALARKPGLPVEELVRRAVGKPKG